MAKNQAANTTKRQVEAFKAAARQAEADTDEARWEARLKAVAKAQPKPETKKPAKSR